MPVRRTASLIRPRGSNSVPLGLPTRVINTTEAYADLTTRRGWTFADWKEWLTGLLEEQLLAPS